MYQSRFAPPKKVKTYDIHPTSIKLLKSGHYWITQDRFSDKFHPKEKFIIAAIKNRPFALLIHDPTHRNVKARLWARTGNFSQMMKNFKNDLISRIRKAVKSRHSKNILEKRNHFYLIFAEGDEIPGLFVRYLNGQLLIEFYMDFWKAYQDFIIQNVLKAVNETFGMDLMTSNIWIQKRSLSKEPALCMDPNSTFRNIEVKEYDVNYKVTVGKYYDCGIYTDMAAIRGKLKNSISSAKSVLNLYAYTGAFSLYALKQGVEEVVSVDVSEDYIQWLENNIELNEDLNKEAHQSMTRPTKEALVEFKEQGKTFDYIICDPPSCSNDGNKTTNALAEYSELLPLMTEVLSEHGQMAIFLNTHKYGHDKFKNKIKTIIQKNELPLSIKQHLFLSEDCPSRKGFPEGSYLKGMVVKRNDSSKEAE